MAYIPLPSINVHRKLNAKLLLTFGIIMMLTLTLFVAIAVRQARTITYGEPWWFLPGSWTYKTGLGSERNVTIATHPADSEIPPPIVRDTANNMTFDMYASAPNASGVSEITIPQESFYAEKFFLGDIHILFITVHLWTEVYAVGDGYGYLATEDGALDVDVFANVTGVYPTYMINTTIGDGDPDPAGSVLIYLPLEFNVYSTDGPADPIWDGLLITTGTLPLWVTTGYSETTIYDETPYPSDQSHPSLDGMKVNGTGVPTDPYTGIFTCIGTGGCLDLQYCCPTMLIVSDFIFKEVMVATPDPPMIPGDIDADGDVDVYDFHIFAGAYGTSPASNPDCDLDGDGDVDIEDFHIFAGNYGKSI